MNIPLMSISAGLLVIAIVLIRAVALHRLPKRLFLVLWGIVLFRLLIPVSISLPFSVPSYLVSIGRFSETEMPGKSLSPDLGYFANIAGAVTGVSETTLGHSSDIAPTKAIWLIGMLALSAFFAVIYFRNHRRLRNATAIRDNSFLNDWLAGNKLTRTITIMQSDRIISPLAVGILRPRIILPKTMNMSDRQLLNYVLAHEYFHIKRYDAIWKMFLLLALVVHWFNPMVWLMFVLASRDLELACDENVIYRFGVKSKKDYAYMLIGMAEKTSGFAPLYSGFSRNATEERIESIMKIKKTTLIGMIAAIVLVSVLGIGMLSAFAPPAERLDANPEALYVGESMYDSGDELYEQRHYPISKNLVELEILEDTTNTRFANFGKEKTEQNPIPEEEPALEHDGFSESCLISVSASSEKHFTPEGWAEVLARVESGEVQWVEE